MPLFNFQDPHFRQDALSRATSCFRKCMLKNKPKCFLQLCSSNHKGKALLLPNIHATCLQVQYRESCVKILFMSRKISQNFLRNCVWILVQKPNQQLIRTWASNIPILNLHRSIAWVVYGKNFTLR